MSENKTKYLDVVGLNHVWTKIKDGFERKGLAQEITDSLRDELSAQIKHLSGLVNITYSELKSKRDSGQLIPGAFYRITDYVTTTNRSSI